jgi:hypothetical protein
MAMTAAHDLLEDSCWRVMVCSVQMRDRPACDPKPGKVSSEVGSALRHQVWGCCAVSVGINLAWHGKLGII